MAAKTIPTTWLSLCKQETDELNIGTYKNIKYKNAAGEKYNVKVYCIGNSASASKMYTADRSLLKYKFAIVGIKEKYDLKEKNQFDICKEIYSGLPVDLKFNIIKTRNEAYSEEIEDLDDFVSELWFASSHDITDNNLGDINSPVWVNYPNNGTTGITKVDDDNYSDTQFFSENSELNVIPIFSIRAPLEGTYSTTRYYNKHDGEINLDNIVVDKFAEFGDSIEVYFHTKFNLTPNSPDYVISISNRFALHINGKQAYLEDPYFKYYLNRKITCTEKIKIMFKRIRGTTKYNFYISMPIFEGDEDGYNFESPILYNGYNHDMPKCNLGYNIVIDEVVFNSECDENTMYGNDCLHPAAIITKDERFEEVMDDIEEVSAVKKLGSDFSSVSAYYVTISNPIEHLVMNQIGDMYGFDITSEYIGKNIRFKENVTNQYIDVVGDSNRFVFIYDSASKIIRVFKFICDEMYAYCGKFENISDPDIIDSNEKDVLITDKAKIYLMTTNLELASYGEYFGAYFNYEDIKQMSLHDIAGFLKNSNGYHIDENYTIKSKYGDVLTVGNVFNTDIEAYDGTLYHYEFQLVDFVVHSTYVSNGIFRSLSPIAHIGKVTANTCAVVLEALRADFCNQLNINIDEVQIPSTEELEFIFAEDRILYLEGKPIEYLIVDGSNYKKVAVTGEIEDIESDATEYYITVQFKL